MPQRSNIYPTGSKEIKDYGTLIIYVPEKNQNFYVKKYSKGKLDIINDRDNTSIDILKALQKGTEQTGFFPVFDGRNSIVAKSASTGKTTKYSNEVVTFKNNFKTESENIPLFMQFVDFSLPETLLYGKKAIGKTTEIPGGKKLTQITGVYSNAISLEFVLQNQFALDKARILEQFSGQRMILFYIETATGIGKNQEFSLKGNLDEPNTLAWFGVCMSVDFEYKNRHLIYAKLNFEPIKDIVSSRIEDLSQQQVYDFEKINNRIKSAKGILRTNNPGYLTTALGKNYDLRFDKFSPSIVETGQNLNTVNSTEFLIQKAKNIKAILDKFDKNTNNSVFKDAINFLDKDYLNFLNDAKKNLDKLSNGVNDVFKITEDINSMTNKFLNPISSLINSLRITSTSLSTGLKGALNTPMNFLTNLKSKAVGLQNICSDLINEAQTYPQFFGNIINDISTSISPKDKPSIADTVKLIDALSTLNSSLLSLDAKANAEKISKELAKAGYTSNILNELDAQILIAYLNNPFNKEIAQSIYKEQGNKIATALELNNKTIDSLGQDVNIVGKSDNLNTQEAKIAKIITIIQKADETAKSLQSANNILHYDPYNALLKIFFPTNTEDAAQTINANKSLTEEQLNPGQNISRRERLIASLSSVLGDKGAETHSLIVSKQIQANLKEYSIERSYVKKYIIESEDLILGYANISIKAYNDAQYARKLEKYNNNKELVIGDIINIPPLNLLL